MTTGCPWFCVEHITSPGQPIEHVVHVGPERAVPAGFTVSVSGGPNEPMSLRMASVTHKDGTPVYPGRVHAAVNGVVVDAETYLERIKEATPV